MKPINPPREAFVYVRGWEGTHSAVVLVVGETPTRYRLRNHTDRSIRIAGRSRWLAPDEETSAPKSAVVFVSRLDT